MCSSNYLDSRTYIYTDTYTYICMYIGICALIEAYAIPCKTTMFMYHYTEIPKHDTLIPLLWPFSTDINM